MHLGKRWQIFLIQIACQATLPAVVSFLFEQEDPLGTGNFHDHVQERFDGVVGGEFGQDSGDGIERRCPPGREDFTQ